MGINAVSEMTDRKKTRELVGKCSNEMALLKRSKSTRKHSSECYVYIQIDIHSLHRAKASMHVRYTSTKIQNN